MKVCAQMILDYCSQFYVSPDHPDYLKYDREKARKLVNYGFYNLCTYDELVAAGLEEYAKEIPASSREMLRLKSFSRVPVAPIAPGSLPPWPGSTQMSGGPSPSGPSRRAVTSTTIR